MVHCIHKMKNFCFGGSKTAHNEAWNGDSNTSRTCFPLGLSFKNIGSIRQSYFIVNI